MGVMICAALRGPKFKSLLCVEAGIRSAETGQTDAITY